MESARGAPGAEPAAHPAVEHQHRDVGGGPARAAVFGVSDGLVSNVGLVLGVAGAAPTGGVVLVAGLAGLVSGAISMAAGEYNSMRVQAELLERELAVERRELTRNPQVETAELAARYEARGVPAEVAAALAESLMRDPEVALEAHARDELGIDPADLGSPFGAAASSFAAFVVGGSVPLVPWVFGVGTGAIVASLVAAVLAAVVVGVLTARFTDRSPLGTAARQVAFTLVPAALAYTIGSVVGAAVGVDV